MSFLGPHVSLGPDWPEALEEEAMAADDAEAGSTGDPDRVPNLGFRVWGPIQASFHFFRRLRLKGFGELEGFSSD